MSLNRLVSRAGVPSLAAAAPASASPSAIESPGVDKRRGGQLATFTPTGYESGYAYPLIVWLHGQGSCERELPKVVPHVSSRNYLAVAPRAGAASGGGFRWRQTDEGIDEAEVSVANAVEAAAGCFNVHEKRVFIGGVGAGGTMALRLALRRPEWFRAALSIDGPLPVGRRPLARINDARTLPLLLASSRESDGYPQSRLCADLSLLHSAGFHVAVRQYPGDDELTTAMLADVNRWLMDLVCG